MNTLVFLVKPDLLAADPGLLERLDAILQERFKAVYPTCKLTRTLLDKESGHYALEGIEGNGEEISHRVLHWINYAASKEERRAAVDQLAVFEGPHHYVHFFNRIQKKYTFVAEHHPMKNLR